MLIFGSFRSSCVLLVLSMQSDLDDVSLVPQTVVELVAVEITCDVVFSTQHILRVQIDTISHVLQAICACFELIIFLRLQIDAVSSVLQTSVSSWLLLKLQTVPCF